MAASVNLPAPLAQRFYDNSGNPASGGKLFCYAAGTSTKQAVYTDSTGTVAMSNPIILDALGGATFWPDTSLTYKYVLTPSTDSDPPTSPIWTRDGVQTPANTASAASAAASAAQPYVTQAQTYANNSQTSASASAASATSAQAYASSAASAAKFFDTIALGLAGVADGATFGVKAGGSDGLTRPTIYQRVNSTTSNLIGSWVTGSEYDALFPATTPSGYAFALLDAYGKAAWGVLTDGTVRAAYLNADTMTATSLLVGSDNIAATAPYGYVHALVDAYGKALYAAKSGSAMDIPDLSTTRVNGVPAYLILRRKKTIASGNYPAEVCHVLSYGQSLSIGATAAQYLQTIAQAYNSVMFNAGVRAYEGSGTSASNRASLVPLIESYNSGNGNGETPCGQFAFMAMRLIEEENGIVYTSQSFKFLMSACGIANTTIAALKTVAGTNFEYDVQYGAADAAALGLTYNVPAVIWTHGTTDITNGTSQASYYADLNTLFANINALVKGYTGQSNNVKLIMSTPFVNGAVSSPSDSTNVGLAMLQAAHNNPDIIIACPEYCFDHQPTNVHLTGIGYGALGGKYGEVYKRVVVDGDTWTALGDDAQITATRQGSILTLTFNNVQRGPLVLDTTNGAVANSGFILKTSGGTPRTISSVAVAGANSVKIVASGLSAGDTIEYGFTTFGGNLRDSEGNDLVLEQRAKRAMHNWCIGFKKTIS